MHSSRIYLNKGPAQLPRAERAAGAVRDQQGMNVGGRIVLQGTMVATEWNMSTTKATVCTLTVCCMQFTMKMKHPDYRKWVHNHIKNS